MCTCSGIRGGGLEFRRSLGILFFDFPPASYRFPPQPVCVCVCANEVTLPVTYPNPHRPHPQPFSPKHHAEHLSYCFFRKLAAGKEHWSIAMDGTDVSFKTVMTTTVDFPEAAKSVGTNPQNGDFEPLGHRQSVCPIGRWWCRREGRQRTLV